MTLVEAMLAIVILTVSVYLLSSTITAAVGHAEVKRERAMAAEAAMNMIERMHGEPFELLFAMYNTEPNDDPGGAGTAPGRHFPVPGLTPQAGDGDGFPGEVIVPQGLVPETIEGPEQGYPEIGVALREDLVLPELAMPRDLNGDVAIDGEDHASDYIVLPVTIRVSWTGRGGNRSIEMSTMFAKLEKVD